MNKKILFPALVIAFLSLLPFILSLEYYILLATYIIFYAALATSWYIIGGMAGQLDFAAASYVGIGVFISGTLITFWEIPYWITLPLGGLGAMALAIGLGYFTFRFGLREVYYALASLASVISLQFLFLLWTEVGGPIPRYIYQKGPIFMRFDSNIYYFYVMLFFMIIALLICYSLSKSKLGFFLRCIRDDEDAAEVLGIDTKACKLKALAIYAFISGMIGTAYVALVGSYDYTVFDPEISLLVVVAALVGGSRVIYGPFTGALVLVGIRELFRSQLGAIRGLSWIFYGIVLLIVILLKPGGIVTLFEKIYKKRNKISKSKDETRLDKSKRMEIQAIKKSKRLAHQC